MEMKEPVTQYNGVAHDCVFNSEGRSGHGYPIWLARLGTEKNVEKMSRLGSGWSHQITWYWI